MLGIPVYRKIDNPKLTVIREGVLQFDFFQQAPLKSSREIDPYGFNCPPDPDLRDLGQQRLTIDVAEIEKDSDNDGWTDIEEDWLGLDPDNWDTDGDRISDGRDVCPDLNKAFPRQDGFRTPGMGTPGMGMPGMGMPGMGMSGMGMP